MTPRFTIGLAAPALAFAAALAVTFAPDVAHACPTCFSANDANRVAYIITFIIMTVLPLAFIGGVVYWLFSRHAALEAEAAALEADHANGPA
ncbi:MAG: hypothetical protein DRJ42_05910 [Deltaproteobacteria bacterium]|nr:MAG: hypothetical protein DRJ42_05910 [Deltaproteobacteria bacterium]